MKAKEAVDRLAGDPSLALSFAPDGKALWHKKEPITEAPIQEQRTICIDKHSGYSTDELLISVLKLNPGKELQLLSYHGTFPYLALKVFGAKDIKVPEGMFVSDGMLCCTEKHFGGTIMIAEIQK